MDEDATFTKFLLALLASMTRLDYRALTVLMGIVRAPAALPALRAHWSFVGLSAQNDSRVARGKEAPEARYRVRPFHGKRPSLSWSGALVM